MSRRRTNAMTAAALLLAACGGEGSEFMVRGATVAVRSDAPFTRSEDFPGRVASTVAAALRYWGGSWSNLDGVTIAFEGARAVACGPAAAVGCFDGDIRVSTLDAGRPVDCVEQTALVHEVGHAIIGDPDHLDPRWLDFAALERGLAGRRGYRDGGEVTCAIYPSVWRHPPGRQHASGGED